MAQNNTYTHTPTPRSRRLSKPSPPEREAVHIKTPNMSTSPSDSQSNSASPQFHPTSLDPRLDPHFQQATSPRIQSVINSSEPASFALQPSDLHNIVLQLKTMLSDEIESTIQIVFKTELENAVKGSIQGFIDEIDTSKKENAQLRDEVDSLEQYGRRELMRFIVENRMENTTTIVTDIVNSIDKDYQNGDVIRSHRVGNPNRSARNGHKLGPRQIIVRVKDPLIKRRILKCTKLLKESEYTHVRVSEELTKRRNAIAYKARQLKKASFVANTWTMDGKIFIKNNQDRISTINTELDLQTYVLRNCPTAMRLVYLDFTSVKSYADRAAAIPATNG